MIIKDIKDYMHYWDLNFDLENRVKEAMESWELPLDLLDVYMNYAGDIVFEARGMSPANEREERMILIGTIDNNELDLK